MLCHVCLDLEVRLKPLTNTVDATQRNSSSPSVSTQFSLQRILRGVSLIGLFTTCSIFECGQILQ